MVTSSPKAVRSPSRTGSKSPQFLRTRSKNSLLGDRQDGDAGDIGTAMHPPRLASPVKVSSLMFKRSSPKPPRKPLVQRTILSRYLWERLPAKLSAVLSVLTVIVALAMFYGEAGGPKLVKRDAPLRPGDRLRGGQYISFCTSIIATGCKPKYFEVGRDGSVGLYAGKGPNSYKG